METIVKLSAKNYLLDTTLKRITFLDNRFYYTPSGEHVPSVTSILDCYPKGAAYYQWLKQAGEDADAIRDDAGRRGSNVHELTELYDLGLEISLLNESGNISYRMSEWNMFERYVEFRNRFAFEIIHNEITLVSQELGYAGTLDRVITINGKRILVDIKTSAAIYPSYWLQLAAYEQLIKHTPGLVPVDDVAILWLNAKTRTEGKKGDIQGAGWQLVIRGADGAKDLALFNATHQLWLAENGDIQPKKFSYQLNHQFIS